MFIGRVTGWALILAAILMASAEAVMALGAGTYQGLVTGDIWALLWGASPDFMTNGLPADFWHLTGAIIMAMPAWAVFGVIGIGLAHFNRKRLPRGRIFRTS